MNWVLIAAVIFLIWRLCQKGKESRKWMKLYLQEESLEKKLKEEIVAVTQFNDVLSEAVQAEGGAKSINAADAEELMARFADVLVKRVKTHKARLALIGAWLDRAEKRVK